jgi:hypothetical protein
MLVMDNLNTHNTSSLYKAFAPEEAFRLAQKLKIHPETRDLAEHRKSSCRRSDGSALGQGASAVSIGSSRRMMPESN